MKPLLPCKSNTHYIFLCVCVCVCVRVRARVWGVSVDAWARVYACARVALLIQHATRMRQTVCELSGSTTFLDIRPIS
jgi:hypothetical protein